MSLSVVCSELNVQLQATETCKLWLRHCGEHLDPARIQLYAV